MAKSDKNFSLITAPNLLRQLYLDTYTDRLRSREIKPELKELYDLKCHLWKLRFEALKANQSRPWSMQDLDKVLKKLKTNKTRDPHGLINEIFKPGVIGLDLKLAILNLFSGIKLEFFLPNFLQFANITTICKKKGSRQDLNNDRGIFVVSVLRMILDSLIYEEKYPEVVKNMSNSNIGARKDRNIRNHLFMVYGAINSVLNGKDDCMDIQIYDVEKCFDALWLEDCMTDLYDTLPQQARDDRLALVYQLNRENYVAVNTAVGQTDRVQIKNIVMQGGKWGPLQCSNSMDKVGKNCAESGGNMYRYKGLVKLIPLAMVDDLLAMAKCGIDSTRLNTEINTRVEMKKLYFHTPDQSGKSKCHTMHIGRKSENCPKLKVHGYEMEKVTSDTYLGDIISSDGKNRLNIENRVAKGLGIVSEIMDMLKTVSFGVHYFEIATTLRESKLINGILTNCDVWHGVTKTDVNQLEEIDKLLLRQIFNVPSACPVEALYLELGCIPIGLVIKSRRLNYLHYLVSRKDDEMLKQFFLAQWNYPSPRGEWTEQTRLDLDEFEITDDLKWIKSKSKFAFKKLVKAKAKELTLELNKRQGKMKNLYYADLEKQEYLTDKKITPQQAKAVFKYKTRMANFSDNFRGGQPTKQCPLCKDESSLDTQQHSLVCKVTKQNVQIDVRYEEIFFSQIGAETAKTLENILKFREEYLNQ